MSVCLIAQLLPQVGSLIIIVSVQPMMNVSPSTALKIHATLSAQLSPVVPIPMDVNAVMTTSVSQQTASYPNASPHAIRLVPLEPTMTTVSVPAMMSAPPSIVLIMLASLLVVMYKELDHILTDATVAVIVIASLTTVYHSLVDHNATRHKVKAFIQMAVSALVTPSAYLEDACSANVYLIVLARQ